MSNAIINIERTAGGTKVLIRPKYNAGRIGLYIFFFMFFFLLDILFLYHLPAKLFLTYIMGIICSLPFLFLFGHIAISMGWMTEQLVIDNFTITYSKKIFITSSEVKYPISKIDKIHLFPWTGPGYLFFGGPIGFATETKEIMFGSMLNNEEVKNLTELLTKELNAKVVNMKMGGFRWVEENENDND
jgi:hypothetical protein